MSLPMTPTVNLKTNTNTKTKTKTKFLKDPTCAIFLKSLGFKDIKYDTHASSARHQRIISASSAHHQCIISASSAHHQTRPGQRRLQSRGPNSRTFVLVHWLCLCLFIFSLNVFLIVFVFVFVIINSLVRSCILITLIKCLKGHKSLGSPLEGAL